MQLSVIEAAGILKVSEDIVYQWIRNHGLPATHAGNRYHISRIKLIEWARRNAISMQVEGGLESPVLENAMQAGVRLQELPVDSIEQAVNILAEELRLPGQEAPDAIASYLAARENCGFAFHLSGLLIPTVEAPILASGCSPAVHSLIFKAPLIVAGKACRGLLAVVAPSLSLHANLITRLLFVLSDRDFVKALTGSLGLEHVQRTLRELSARKPESAPTRVSWWEEDN